MAASSITIDTVRASRDGHQFHEAWIARSALALLLPKNDFCGIAVEGFAEEDEVTAGQEATEIADATFYYGIAPGFKTSSRIQVVQFKYSIASQNKEIRFSDVRKTIRKFYAAEKDFVSNHGTPDVSKKLEYKLVTNRPISADLERALISVARSETLNTTTNDQIKQILEDLKGTTDQVASFVSRVTLQGSSEQLHTLETDNFSIVANWSASTDTHARARLGDLRKLVRDKAGSAGQGDNLIVRVDVLAALGVGEVESLLPCPDAFVDIGEIVVREQAKEFIGRLSQSNRWLVHAPGGTGKTVFVQGIAQELSKENEVVIFDCFGGGAYRAVTDSRHRPERGLVHIVNTLACRGLCDPILPESNDASVILKRSIDRFEQVIGSLRQRSPNCQLVLILDATDNAAVEARDRHQLSFPRELLLALSKQIQPAGLVMIGTCRTERRDLAVAHLTCTEFALSGFSVAETGAFLSSRKPMASAVEIASLFKRSVGNPRILAALLEENSITETDTPVLNLDDLLEGKIKRAISATLEKGAAFDAIDSFLCALTRLPPPVPLEQLANALGLQVAETLSLVADLSPLLEQTRHGIIFRDEPTETYVRINYGEKFDLLQKVADRLEAYQNQSVYVARTLPGLLLAMGNVERLQKLAINADYPKEIDSEIAKREIKLTRLRAAIGSAVAASNCDAMVDLAVEISATVAGDERGEDYLDRYPDLVVSLGDSEMLRRLSTSRSGWFGARPSRMVVAYTCDNETGEAYSFAKQLEDWLSWQHRQNWEDRETPRPSTSDRAAIGFFLTAIGRTSDAMRYLRGWQENYLYFLGCKLARWLRVSKVHQSDTLHEISPDELLRARLAAAPIIVAMLNSGQIRSADSRKATLRALASKLRRLRKLKQRTDDYWNKDTYENSLTRCALSAASLDLGTETLQILSFVSIKRYSRWELQDRWHANRAVPWLLTVAAESVAKGKHPSLADCFPAELWKFVENEQLSLSEEALRKQISEKLKEAREELKSSTGPKKDLRNRLSELDDCESVLRSRVGPALELCRSLVGILQAKNEVDSRAALDVYLKNWEKTRNKTYDYERTENRRFFDQLHAMCLTQVIWAVGCSQTWNGTSLFQAFQESEFTAPETWVKLVELFSNYDVWHEFAGKLAKHTADRIQEEDDVERKAGLLSELAHALMPANKTEAKMLFKQGLIELDAIGSGDQDFTIELLHLAATLREVTLKPEAAFRLAKICELNNYDSDKFPWPLVGKAFSRSWGPASLAQLARWHDRDKVNMRLVLPVTLASLVRDKKLSATDGVVLLGLVEVDELWDWGWHNIAEAVLESEDGGARQVQHLLELCEKQNPVGLSSHRFESLRNALQKNEDVFTEVENSLESLEQAALNDGSAASASKVSENSPDPILPAAVDQPEKSSDGDQNQQPVDPTSLDSIELLLEATPREKIFSGHLKPLFSSIRQQVKYSQRSDHVKAIVSARNLPIDAKCDVLDSIREEWEGSSPTALGYMKGLGTELVKIHAEEFSSLRWSFQRTLKRVADLSSEPLRAIAIKLMGEFVLRDIQPDSRTWMGLATILSEFSNAKAARDALDRLLTGDKARLTDKIGDGLWTEDLDAGSDTSDSVASLVWFSLGSPVATERWRAAHVVRSFAKFNQWEVISRLVAKLDKSDAGPFQDRRLPFFWLHAKHWLLIALARVAMESPLMLAEHSGVLEKVAFDDTFPHVGIRKTASQILASIYSVQRGKKIDAKIVRLSQVNRLVLSTTKTSERPIYDGYARRPNDKPEPENVFHFGYEFEKYELATFGRVFGMPNWEVGDFCRKWIGRWSPGIKHMSDLGGRTQPHRRNRYDDGNGDGYHSYGTYLAWHAMAVAAGDLLKTHSVSEDEEDNAFDDWLTEFGLTRSDGNWIADGTQSYPGVARASLLKTDDEEFSLLTEFDDLLRLCELSDNQKVTGPSIIDGSWTSIDGVSVRVLSCFVPISDTSICAQAVAVAPPHHRWLPVLERYDDDENRRRWGSDYAPMEPWLVLRDAEAKLDGKDPFASQAALSTSYPSKRVINAMGLTCKDAWKHQWDGSDGRPALRAQAWGVKQGSGEYEKWETGKCLRVEPWFLKDMLMRSKRNLLLMVQLSHYREKKNYGLDDDDDTEKFKHALAVVTIDHSLCVTRATVSDQMLRLIDGLSQYDRPDFRARLRAISEMDAKNT